MLAETFCDIERSAGTCYRTAGWEAVGKTKGFSRVNHARNFYIPNGRPKVLFMKPFRRNAWELIAAKDLSSECDVAAHAKADGVLPLRPGLGLPCSWSVPTGLRALGGGLLRR